VDLLADCFNFYVLAALALGWCITDQCFPTRERKILLFLNAIYLFFGIVRELVPSEDAALSQVRIYHCSALITSSSF
jgi:hypothetical protein